MNYLLGMIKYMVKGPFTNPIAFYIYGAGVFALLNAFPHFLEGQFVVMALDFFTTKYLPPTSLGQVISQVVVGSGAAGIKWFFLTPRV